jgi:hypothetical protein
MLAAPARTALHLLNVYRRAGVTAVLIVDAELPVATALALDLAHACARMAEEGRPIDVTALGNFSNARSRLKERQPTLLVTALQLRAYNGMHLVYVAAGAELPTRCVVHTDAIDPLYAREVRAAGAFYETRARLPVALPAYVAGLLPPRDRRETLPFDRRQLWRGGRRSVDRLHAADAAPLG